MAAMFRWASQGWTLGVAGAVLAGTLAASLPTRAADHRDGPIFGPPGITITNSRRDINDIYVFRSPANANNTVFIVTLSPFSTATTPAIFDENLVYDIKVDTGGSIVGNITFRVTFSPPDGTGVQDVTLRGIPGARFPPNGILAQGKTRQNLPVQVVSGAGAQFRAGEQDDPFFFDAVGFNQLLNGGAFPRPPGTAANFFGPNVNTLSIVLEIPSVHIGPVNSLIGVWARTEFAGVQLDRMGRPAINTALIPPVPRGSNFPIGGSPDQNRQERRNAFNAGHPAQDRTDFTSDMVSVFQNFLGRTLVDSNALTNLLLPDVLIFQIGNPNGFGTFVTSGTGQGGVFAGTVLGNGRRLRDDVIDIELNVLTNGAITTDNVPDDNGTRITDGNMGTTAAFPYIGVRNAPPTGLPGPTPPP